MYDYFLTLSDEVCALVLGCCVFLLNVVVRVQIKLVWPSPWRLPKILFFFNRYLAFVDPAMLVKGLYLHFWLSRAMRLMNVQ